MPPLFAVILYPAIDIRGGRCVRLVQGDFEQETAYDDDPINVARVFAGAGATWLHVVDLDAARGPGAGTPGSDRTGPDRTGSDGAGPDRTGSDGTGPDRTGPDGAGPDRTGPDGTGPDRTGPDRAGPDGAGSDNRDLIEALAAIVPIPIQVGGGVRDGTLLERGVARVVVGSLAVSDPDAVRRLAASYPGRVAVGLDHRDGEIRIRGWSEGSSLSLSDALAAVDCPSLGAVVVTDIGRDGMLAGPDLDGLAAVLALTDTPVIASGGVGSVVDLRALAGLRATGSDGAVRRLAGAIVGKAIYEGKVDLFAGLRALEAIP